MSSETRRNKALLIIAWVLSVAIAATVTFLITSSIAGINGGQGDGPISTEELYSLAMNDSVYADAEELRELVEITCDSDMVTWNEDGTKVLMLSWNRHPERYIGGESFTLGGGEIWTFTDREILYWYKENGENAEDIVLRLEQLIGLPEDSGYTHVSAFWVEPDEMIRPAYNTDITGQVEESHLSGSSLGEYKDWFEGNIIWSYFDSAYPWTRLGYTYDWAENSGEYGLSEFIILPGSEVEVEFTVSTEEFISMLKLRKSEVD